MHRRDFLAWTVFQLLASASPVFAGRFPRRIVSLGPLNTENVYLLGAGDLLVGNTRYCVRPPAARNKVKVGSVLQISVEKVLALRPDLVLATGLTPPALLRQLRRLGIRVVQVKQPDSFAGICRVVEELGSLLGREKQAQEIVSRSRVLVRGVQARVAGRPRPPVFLQVGLEPLYGAVPGSFTHDFIRLAGGVNILEDQENGLVDEERVLARDPEVILIAIMGGESGAAARARRKWERFPALRAVREGRIHILDPDLVCSPSPLTFARTLERIALFLHPQSTP